MKINTSYLAVFALFFAIFSQSVAQEPEQAATATVNLNLLAIEKNGAPIPNTDIHLVEIESRKVLTQKTDAKGRTTFKLTFGSTWQIQLRDIKDYYQWQVEMPESGARRINQKIVYNQEKYQRSLRPPVDRKTLLIKIVKQSVSMQEKTEKDLCLYTLNIKKKNGQPLQRFSVQLTNYSTLTSYLGTTNAAGIVKFKLPMGLEYEVDLEGINEYKHFRVPVRPFGVLNQTITFEPMNFEEKVVKGCIIQDLKGITQGTSARNYCSLTFRERNTGHLRANETVTIEAMEDGMKYQATTDAEGIARFMLPKGKHYLYRQQIFENFHHEVMAIDLSRAFGIGKSSRTVFVLPSTETLDIPEGFKVLQTAKGIDWNDFFKDMNVKVEDFQNLSTPYYARNHLSFIDENNLVGIDRGFLMTTGSFLNAFGPNDSPGASQLNSVYKATNLPAAIDRPGQEIYDPCYLKMKITPEFSTLELSYVFASEEYPEYPLYDDAFGIFLFGGEFNGSENLALIPGTETGISVTPLIESNGFIDNTDESKASFLNWQYDGFSTKITQRFTVTPGETYEIKFIAYDLKDGIYDTGVFVGFKSTAAQ